MMNEAIIYPLFIVCHAERLLLIIFPALLSFEQLCVISDAG